MDTQHPQSWERIQELERPKIVEEVEIVEEREKPRFLTQLESVSNTEGEAASSGSVKVAGIGDILGETHHEESWRRIQELEAPREKSPTPPPPEYDAPSIQTQINDIECNEGEPSRFEAVVHPTNDPTLKITWVRNNVPLAHGSKFAISQDFGLCILDIGYTFPEDEVGKTVWYALTIDHSRESTKSSQPTRRAKPSAARR